MRTLSILAIIFATIAIAWTADVQPTLPKDAQVALDKFEAVKAKIDAEAAKATEKELDKLVIDFQKAITVETKKGNLDGAIAIKSKMEELTNKHLQTDLLGRSPLVGKSFLFKNETTASPICVLKLDESGRLIGATHSNESTWEQTKDNVIFKNAIGIESSVFNKIVKSPDGKYKLTGKFVLNGSSLDVSLTER